MKHLEILGTIYQESVNNLMSLFQKARQAPAGSAGDVYKILFDRVRDLGDVARTINAVREVENYKKPTPNP